MRQWENIWHSESVWAYKARSEKTIVLLSLKIGWPWGVHDGNIFWRRCSFLGANDSTQNYLRVYVLGIILALLFCLKFLFDAINPIWEELKIKSFSLILIGKGWCSDDSLLLIGTWAQGGCFLSPIRRFKRRKIRNRNEKSFGQNEIHRLQGLKWNHYRISRGRAIWFIKWSDAGIMG